MKKIKKRVNGIEASKVKNQLKKDKKIYSGSIVLGLNDAIVEITGVLVGLTLALQNSKIIFIAGIITGIAASLSMAASEYLSVKAEVANSRKIIRKKPITSAFYTGFSYIFTVLFLVFPYLILSEVYYSLIWTLINAIIVIFIFTYYISIEKKESFKHRFLEMFVISFSIALISFIFGYLIRIYFF